MTDKKLKVGNTAYTELSIQIGVLEAKVDRILQLFIEQQDRQYEPYIPNLDFIVGVPAGIPDNETFDEEFK